MLKSDDDKEFDVFELLGFLSNTTRRNILELLAGEDLYPFQISRILEVSPRIIKEYLNELEKLGLISLEKRDSDKGPQRTYASLNNAFSLIVDVSKNTFDVKYVPTGKKPERYKGKDLEKIIKSKFTKDIAEIRDNVRNKLKEVQELDEKRKTHIEEINEEFHHFNRIINQIFIDYEDRNIIRNMFTILVNKPDNRISLTELASRLRIWRGDLGNKINFLARETNLIEIEADRRGEIWYSI